MGQIIAKHTSDAPIFNVYFKNFPGRQGASRLRRSLSQGNPQFLLQLSSKLPGQLPPKVSLEPCMIWDWNIIIISNDIFVTIQVIVVTNGRLILG